MSAADMTQPPVAAKVSFLSRVGLFHGMDAKLLGVLAGLMDLKRLAAGTVLCEEGAPGDSCFVIGNGSAVVVARDPAGGERVLATLKVGQTVGEVALIDGKKRSATVRCATDASIFFLRRDDFERLLQAGNPASFKLLENITQILAKRLREANSKYADIFSHAGDTMAELQKRLREVQASIESDEADEGAADNTDSDSDLLKMMGYVSKGVPSSR